MVDCLQKPYQVVFVIDSSMGQISFDQALAFKKTIDSEAMIVTKMDEVGLLVHMFLVLDPFVYDYVHAYMW